MTIQLTEGCIAAILQGEYVENPVVQLINHKRISSNSASDKYRVIISDGRWYNSCTMLATQLNDLVMNNELSELTIIRLDNFIVSELSSGGNAPGAPRRKVIVIMALTVLQNGKSVGRKLGDPQTYEENSTSFATLMDSTPSGSSSFGTSNRPSSSNVHNGLENTIPVNPVHRPPANANANCPLGGPVFPIESLNPYLGRWNIMARVTSKQGIRTWSNARSEGKCFTMDLADSTGAIRATAFNDRVDQFHDIFDVNRIYYISRCTVKQANKRFTTIPHDFELHFKSDTQVLLAPDDDSSIPQLQFNFTPLSALKDLQPDSVVDIIGVCKSAGDVQNLVVRTWNRETKKRDVTLVDQTDAKVTLTLWGTQAEEFDGSLMPVIAVKAVRVTEFGGAKSVSMGASSTMQLNPDIEKSHRLRGWFDSLDDDHQFSSILKSAGDGGAGGKVYLLKEISTHNLGMQDKADFFNSEAIVMLVPNDRTIYPGCPNPDCKKKVIDQNDNTYRCEKCNQTFGNFVYRLMLSIRISDWTGSQWISLFSDQAETLMGATAQEVGNSRDSYGGESFDSYFKRPLFKMFNFRIRAKLDSYNNESRLRFTASSVRPIDFKETNKRLLNEIKTMSAISIRT